MMENYGDACTEVYTILNNLNEHEYKKIPKNIIKVIKDNRNLEYDYEYDKNIELKQQKLLKETKAILFNLFRDYLCTEKQRAIIKKQQAEERNNNELKKSERFDAENIEKIFKNRQKERTQEQIQMIEHKEESVLKKIINKIVNLFRHN